MKKPTLIVITGKPASGKTTLAKNISKILRIPYISKDEIKEIIFDKIGFDNKEWSMKCNGASYTILYLECKKILSAGQNVIIESNFKPGLDDRTLNEIADGANASVIQIYCKASDEILYDRFVKRSISGNRHPGHNDGVDPESDRQKHFSAPLHPLAIECKYIEIDTTDFEKINPVDITNKIKGCL